MSAQLDGVGAATRPSKRQRTSSDVDKSIPLQCQVCHRSYERADHLNRHLDSHRNERPFRCEGCPAAFNRRDLLLRHQATHAKNAADGQIGPNRTAQRATKACDACVLSKVKCDNRRPCKRCETKNLACTTRVTSRSDSFTFELGNRADSTFASTPEQEENATSQTDVQSDAASSGLPFYEVAPDAQALLDLYNSSAHQQQIVPSFFDQIMVSEPEHLGIQSALQPPPDLTTWMPELDWLGQIDLFSNDFAPAINQTFEAQQFDHSYTDVPEGPGDRAIESPHDVVGDESARLRHAIFVKRSPWLWVPERNQHAFSEHEGITLDERNVDLASSPHRPYVSNVTIPDRLSPQSRDRIFQLVSKTARSQISITPFPSADCLEKLIKAGIAKRTETDAWIHPYTFDSESSTPEFLTALVAAGCVCFGIPSVSRTGLVLQEIVRVALNTLSEQDNSAIRDLQFLQASMLWIDIGAFCGFRRKMEIAESSLQPLVTALRRAGCFDHVRYPLIIPSADDSDEGVEIKWKQWIERESYARLVYHLFEHDIDMAMVKHRHPLISYAEITLPMPASDFLWLASSAEVWRTRFLSGNHDVNSPSLRSLLQDDSSILYLTQGIDAQIARSAYLHGIAAQTWEHFQQSLLLHDSSDPAMLLWSRSRQQKLHSSLQHANLSLDNSPAVACMFHQFLQMYLHVNLDAITRFAGKCGEEEAYRAYMQLQAWSQTKEARIAIWHAGQLLRAARAIPPYQNRGPDSFTIYHAMMVLWTYSMMIRDRAKKTGNNTPVRNINERQSAANKQPTVLFLDDPTTNQADVDAFILLNRGTPCLHMASNRAGPEKSQICNLKYPSQVMKVGVEILDGTYPDVERELGPPLLRALCGLMEEFAGLRPPMNGTTTA